MTTRNRFASFQDDPFFNQNSFGGLTAQPTRIQGIPTSGGSQNNRGLRVEQPTPLSASRDGDPFNVFQDFLEEEPNIPFQAALQRGNLTPNQLQFFRNDRKNFFDRFEGLLGQQIQQGQTPNLRFTDFINDIDFNREFQLTPPNQRPGSGNRFNPRTRFI